MDLKMSRRTRTVHITGCMYGGDTLTWDYGTQHIADVAALTEHTRAFPRVHLCPKCLPKVCQCGRCR